MARAERREMRMSVRRVVERCPRVRDGREEGRSETLRRRSAGGSGSRDEGWREGMVMQQEEWRLRGNREGIH